jgi:hypothetical protein
MGDAGKALTMRTLVMAIAQWIQCGYGGTEVKLYSVSSALQNFSDWRANTEYPIELLSCSGNTNFEALNQVLGGKLEGEVLLLTDGYFSQNQEKIHRKLEKYISQNTLRIIKIGTDANPKLKGRGVFAAEDFFAAMSGWLESGLS